MGLLEFFGIESKREREIKQFTRELNDIRKKRKEKEKDLDFKEGLFTHTLKEFEKFQENSLKMNPQTARMRAEYYNRVLFFSLPESIKKLQKEISLLNKKEEDLLARTQVLVNK